ncbi:HEXXH motif-containing putative peptide modification protein [Streptomyces sp. NBC_00876]|uniref:aKG-HExxH-type peptide beta-hydroxylase n=1 Tax=Streptomyces sp. NBC_00876 TaxID=2975853 RepID=UPI0038677647|nr:HEXXH motif-containing putative peptide modification protein [Streptomyces sp. NBC_00876]
MRVEPDARGAVHERTQLLHRMRRVLERAELTPPGLDRLHRPAVVEVVHIAQRALRSGPLDAAQHRKLTAGLARVTPSAFGPADPKGHLSRSVARALRSVPVHQGADGQPVTAEVAPWQEHEREALAQAVALLNRVWPQAAAEVRETVAEIALLDGEAIDGFTDFTIHGAILVNRVRLTAGATGLPGPVRFAEALVHEGAHTRCNAAALTDPFLLPDRPQGPDASDRGGQLLIATPLRADPRPLTGLFQQTVVLARSVLLYRRLAGLGQTVTARHETLLGSAHQAVDTLGTHSGKLTAHGRRLLDECAGVLGVSA